MMIAPSIEGRENWEGKGRIDRDIAFWGTAGFERLDMYPTFLPSSPSPHTLSHSTHTYINTYTSWQSVRAIKPCSASTNPPPGLSISSLHHDQRYLLSGVHPTTHLLLSPTPLTHSSCPEINESGAVSTKLKKKN